MLLGRLSASLKLPAGNSASQTDQGELTRFDAKLVSREEYNRPCIEAPRYFHDVTRPRNRDQTASSSLYLEAIVSGHTVRVIANHMPLDGVLARRKFDRQWDNQLRAVSRIDRGATGR